MVTQGSSFGYNLIGFISGNFGLGVAARNTARVLHHRGIRLKIVDIDLGDGRYGQDLSCEHMSSSHPHPAPYGVNLFHMNPLEIRFALHSHRDIDTRQHMNGCVPFWELSALPIAWVDMLSQLDFVMAPTEFIRSAITSSLPSLHCFHYPQTVILPDDIKADRPRWGLPQDAVVFATAFDMNSDIYRKNPWASLRAFRAAFPRPKDEYLLVKVSANEHARARWARELSELRALADECKHVIIVDEILSYADVLSIYASCDVFVSLHRSEGLGLCLMEAMTLGKAVVSTAWSGNMDFTNDQNACLVEYDLIPAVSTHPAYDPATLEFHPSWAEARVDHAAACLLRLRDDSNLRRKLGARAREDMAQRRKRFWRGLVWDQVKQQVVDPRSSLSVMAQQRRSAV